MSIHLYLIRHGEAESNIANHASNDGDFSLREKLAHKSPSEYRLTDVGIGQARLIDSLFARDQVKFDIVFTSPMLRAIETALHATEQSNGDTTPYVDELLRERSWGIYEHTTSSPELHAKLWRERDHYTSLDWTPENGDSYISTMMRALEVLKRHLVQKNQGLHIALVSHAEFIWFIERALTNGNNAVDARIPLPDELQHNCAVRHWCIDPQEPHSMKLRSNSKDKLDMFDEWHPVEPRAVTRAELRSIIERSERVLA